MNPTPVDAVDQKVAWIAIARGDAGVGAITSLGIRDFPARPDSPGCPRLSWSTESPIDWDTNWLWRF